jgi:hypothetical protein
MIRKITGKKRKKGMKRSPFGIPHRPFLAAAVVEAVALMNLVVAECELQLKQQPDHARPCPGTYQQ